MKFFQKSIFTIVYGISALMLLTLFTRQSYGLHDNFHAHRVCVQCVMVCVSYLSDILPPQDNFKVIVVWRIASRISIFKKSIYLQHVQTMHVMLTGINWMLVILSIVRQSSNRFVLLRINKLAIERKVYCEGFLFKLLM